MRKAKNLFGKRFGRLVVVSAAGKDRSRNPAWLCKCDCGRRKIIRGAHLQDGSTSSCGCKRDNQLCTHGLSRTPEHIAWIGMNSRCSPRSSVERNRFDYSGRGIAVCSEWKGVGGFERFLAHIGPRPSSEHSLDRIDNDSGYAPGNVRWATRSVQAFNRRKPRRGLKLFSTDELLSELRTREAQTTGFKIDDNSRPCPATGPAVGAPG